MQAFPHLYLVLHHPYHPNPKNQHKTHQNLEKKHLYETSEGTYGGKENRGCEKKDEGLLPLKSVQI